MDIFEPWRNAPPARHNVESDSEDEQDPEDIFRQGSSSQSRAPRRDAIVEIRWTDTRSPTLRQGLMVACDEAGMSWSQGLDGSKLTADAFLFVDNVKAGSLSSIASKTPVTIAFIAASFSYEVMHAVAKRLTEDLDPSQITILDSYSLSSYLSNNPPNPCIRCITSSESSESVAGVVAFEPPNLLQGLAAALASKAAEAGLSYRLLLFPSSLSDSTSASSILHSSRRQPIPDNVYDYGGPLPGQESLLMGSKAQATLADLARQLGWDTFGWKAAGMLDGGSQARQKEGQGDGAGFGWWHHAKRAHKQAISEGGMYV